MLLYGPSANGLINFCCARKSCESLMKSLSGKCNGVVHKFINMHELQKKRSHLQSLKTPGKMPWRSARTNVYICAAPRWASVILALSSNFMQCVQPKDNCTAAVYTDTNFRNKLSRARDSHKNFAAASLRSLVYFAPFRP